MRAVKVRHATVKWLEEELAFYHDTKQELQELEEDIIHGRRHDETGIRAPGYSDPTAERAIALVEHRRIQHLRSVVRAIERVLQNLTPEQMKYVELRYWSRGKNLSTDDIAGMLHVSPRTLYRWREEILQQLAVLMGVRLA